MKKDDKKMMRIIKIVMLSVGVLTAAAILADWYMG